MKRSEIALLTLAVAKRSAAVSRQGTNTLDILVPIDTTLSISVLLHVKQKQLCHYH